MIDGKRIEKIVTQVERNRDEELQFLSRLITHKTLVGQEGPGQDFYAQACRDLGLQVELYQASLEAIKTHPAYVKIDLEYAGRPNVIAEMNGGGGGRSLILNGHMDVVSPEPVSAWRFDPWGGEIRENRVYGRGSVDMKAGLAANLFALKAVLDSGLRMKGKVILESTIEEEAGGSGGTLACFLHGIKADGMIISEPSREGVWVTHPGIMYFRVKVLGLPAHAALSHKGVNAIVKMIPIVKALEALDLKRAKTLSYPLVEKQTGRPCNLSLGKLTAGDWVSTVAGWAVLEGRVGFVPGETKKQVQEELEQAVGEAVREDEWFRDHPPQVEWFGWMTDPWVEPQDSPFIKNFLAAAERVLGAPPVILGSSGGLDNRFGPYFSTPSFSFGPAGGNHHSIDEYVEIPSLLRVTQTLAVFAAEWCGLTD
jgi:acetylornithine deacetylase